MCRAVAPVLFFAVSIFGGFFPTMEKPELRDCGSSAEMETIAPLTAPGGYDVINYDLTFDLKIPSDTLIGHSKITLVALDETAESGTLIVDMGDNLTLDSAFVDGASASPAHISNTLTFAVSGIVLGDTIIIDIFYWGRGNGSVGYQADTTRYGTIVYHTFAEPVSARRWYPCHDIPADKATSSLSASVPAGYFVVSNGILDSTISTGDRTIFFWRESHQIATYLISIACYPYTAITVPTASIPLTYYCYPEDSSMVARDWSCTPDAISFFSETFHPYPFDKYSMAEVVMGGAMEHQTCTSMGESLVDGDGTYYTVVAHELSHHWWGDMITCGTWADIWLNEGFASYCEVLYVEHLYGESSRHSYIADQMSQYFSWEDWEGRFPIYNPDYMWGGTVYKKGSCVLDMLRTELGDSLFFAVLREYASRYEYGTAETDDFIAVCEEISGDSLGWFFDQWVFEQGYPEIEYDWGIDGSDSLGWDLTLKARQVQEDAPAVFRFPFYVRVTFLGYTDTVLVVPFESDSIRYMWHFALRPMAIEPNADARVVMKTTRVTGAIAEIHSIPVTIAVIAYPNPFNSSCVISGVPVGADVSIYDLQGNVVYADDIGGQNFEPLQNGTRSFIWRPDKSVPSGIYIARARLGFCTITKRIIFIK